ncbi:MAG: hemagglutinin repeat-containing protein, partial [Fusobacterium periodonticum]|nr:hemagglutinin repeat-containing protein [Fusobacterium periodonticum]
NISVGNLNNTGAVATEKKLEINGSLENKGKIQAIEDIKISENASNSGSILTNSKFSAKDLRNTNELKANKEISVKNLENTGNILTGDILNVDGSLNNSGNIQANSKIEVANNLNNNGNIKSLDSISINGNVNNDGEILTNKNFIAKDAVSSKTLIAKENISVSNLNNTGAVATEKKLNVNGTLLNNGEIISENINLATLNNNGKIVVKENFNAKDISNTDSIKVGGTLNVDNLKNSKNILASNINIEKSLDNINGTISSENTKINTNDIKNTNGSIQATKNIEISTTETLNLEGKYLANDSLNIKADSLINNTKFENFGKIKITLNKNLINNNKISSNDDLEINTKSLINNGNIGSLSKLTIDTSSFENTGTLLFGNNDNNILKIKENSENKGIINSLANINIDTKNFVNRGQIASKKDLNIKANMFTNIEDSLVFSSSNTNFDIEKDFLNKGEIYSDKDINIITKGKVTNDTANINAQNNIKIEAKKIENIGKVNLLNPTVEKKSALDSNVEITSAQKAEAKKYFDDYVNRKNEEKGFITNNDEQEGFKSYDNLHILWIEEIKSNDSSNLSYISANNNISLSSKEGILNSEANILANKDINIFASQVENKSSVREFPVKVLWSADIYEATCEIIEHGEGPTDPETGEKRGGDSEERWDNVYVGNETFEGNVTQKIASNKATKISAGGNLNIVANKVGNGFDSNIGTKSINIEKVNIAIDNNIETKGFIDTKDFLNFPKGDKGLFKIDNNFSLYLIKTNVKFIDSSSYIGADYLFKNIKFTPDKDLKLIGDSIYETKLISKAIMETTGQRFLGSYRSDKEQMKGLFDNAISERERLDLKLGVSLSDKQISELKSNIIWYVEENINGKKVLIPKVYLTKNNLKYPRTSIEATGSLNIVADEVFNASNMSAKKVSLELNNLTNISLSKNLASINGENIDIKAKNNISNIGSIINAKNNLNISAVQIKNISTQHINTNVEGIKKSTLENISKIEAGNNILIKTDSLENLAGNIKSGNDLNIKSSDVEIGNISLNNKENKRKYELNIVDTIGSEISGKNIHIDNKNNIKISGSNIRAEEKVSINSGNISITSTENKFYQKDGDGGNYRINEVKKNNSSNIEGNNININAKNDIDIKGSNIISKNETNIKADGDVNIVSATDSEYFAHKESRKKKFGRSRSEETINYRTSNVASNVIGDKVNITSGKDVNILGSNVVAQDSGNISAKGNITEAATKDINYSYHQKTKKGFGGLTGKSVTEELHQEINAESNLYVKNKAVIDGDIKVLGSNLVLGDNSIINGKLTTDSNELHSSYSLEEKKKGFSSSIGSGGFSVGYGKSQSKLKEKDLTNAKSNLVLGDNVTLNKGAEITATNFTHGKVTVNNGDVKFGARKDTRDVETSSKSSGVNLSVRIKSEALDRAKQGVDSVNQ